MKHTRHAFALMLLLLCFAQTAAFAQSSDFQTIPKSLRGYWEFKTDNVTNWNGPLIGTNFVENNYTVFYAEQMERESDGSYYFHLRSQKGDKTEFRITPITTDSATIWYKGWKDPKNCVRRQVPSHTQMLTPSTLPANVYQKWVKGLNGKVIYEFTNDGKLLYDGKTWDILSAGHFLNKEYRLLARSGEFYKLIYLSFLFPGVMKVVSELQGEKVSPIASRPEVYASTGCWVDRKTGEWSIGFFENFAVYQCKFWEYESIRLKKKQAILWLKNGTERMKVQMKRKGETSCKLAFGKEKAQVYTLCNGKHLPDYPVADTTSFVNNGYRTDSVTLVGYLRNPPSRGPFEVSVPDMITDEEEEYKTEIDSLGRFTIRFPVLNSNDIFIDWQRTNINVSVEPGETYFLYVDFAEQKEMFMGKKARILNELLYYKPLSEYLDYYKGKEMSSTEYLHKTQEIIQRKSEYRDKLLREHPLLSQKYRYCSEQEIRYNAAKGLMQRRFSLNRQQQEHLDKDLMAYVDSALYPQPVQPYTLLRNFGNFMRDYTGYINDILPSSKTSLDLTPQNMERLYHQFEAAGKVRLSQEEKDALRSFSEFEKEAEKLTAAKADSLTMVTFAQSIVPATKVIQQLVDRDGLLNEYMMEQMHVNAVDCSTAIIDSLQMDKDLREILKTNIYYKMLQDTRKALPDNLVSKFKKEVTNPALQVYVLSQQKKYEEISQKAIEYPESLMPNESLAGMTDGEQLLRKIIEPYRGKVIYLDIWGTWCGPCKDMMQYVGNVKKIFAGKEVVFLYLCNNSSDKSWKNIIKEYGLTGKSAVHYNLPAQQQGAIEKYLEVRSFPTYMLIDKEGNIVNRDPPRPNMTEGLINIIYKELEK